MNDPLKTFLGKDIPVTTRGILYICKLHPERLEVVREILFDNAYQALMAYANTPNPESHIASGETFDEMIKELITLHQALNRPDYAKDLHNFI